MYIYLSIQNGKPSYIPNDMDIHHKNKNTYDNRIENLELMDRAEHKYNHTKTINRICNLCNKPNNKFYYSWIEDIIGYLCYNCYQTIRYHRKKFGMI